MPAAQPIHLTDTHQVVTHGKDYVEITSEIQSLVSRSGVADGLVTLFIKHTSASLTVQENADPDVLRDMRDALDRLAPEGAPYRHYQEGPDDMPAHIKSVLTSTSLSIPVSGGRLTLGTWQGIFVLEHRSGGHRRNIAVHIAGVKS